MKTGISLEEAIELIVQNITPLGTEPVSLFQLLGRTPAFPIAAPINNPPFDRSPLDGYALRSVDTKGATQQAPVKLTVVDTVYAGDVPCVPLKEGQAIKIMTGAMLPPGCDCVLMQERTDMGCPTVSIYKEMQPRENYCRRGEDFKFGTLLLPAGVKADAVAVGVLASAGVTDNIPVFRRPSVAVLCTGNEIVLPGVGDNKLPFGKIYDSNAHLIAARLCELGFPNARIEWAQDDAQTVCDVMRRLVGEYDVIITTGGVSVGEKDIMPDALALLNAESIFHRVNMKPGTPALFSKYEDVPILSLSGNPFAAAATFELLARPLLAAMTEEHWLFLQQVEAVMQTAFEKPSAGRRLIRGHCEEGKVYIPGEHSSSVLSTMLGCNCLIDIPAGSGPVPAGETVQILLL